MIDGVTKGTGNSRYMKADMSAINSFDDLKAALAAGTFTFDLNGINSAGWDVLGTPLSKATLLTDETASDCGLSGNDATVNNALRYLRKRSNDSVSTFQKLVTGRFC